MGAARALRSTSASGLRRVWRRDVALPIKRGSTPMGIVPLPRLNGDDPGVSSGCLLVRIRS